MITKKADSYIIITPVKNEEKNIPILIESILNQTKKPILWVIVNDGCTDNTMKIIEDTKKDRDWILSIDLENSEWALGLHYSEVCMKGFSFSEMYSKKNGIMWEYIGIVDGDMKLNDNYFEKLIDIFNANRRLGIASGKLYSLHNGKFKYEHIRDNEPIGGARLWRKKCIIENPYQSHYSADSVSNAKAKLNGWETKIISEVTAFQMRRIGSSKGLRKGAVYNGKSCYYRGFTPLFAFFKGLKLYTKYPFYLGFWYWFGYYSSLLKRMDKIADKDIIEYYSKTRTKEMKKYYSNKIRAFLRLKSEKL